MNNTTIENKNWQDTVIKPDENARYLIGEKDFIDDGLICAMLEQNKAPDPAFIRDIIAKSRMIETLLPEETAALLAVKDEALWDEMFCASADIKKKVYDNRIVTFAPLYCSNLCVNNCSYCGFRRDNQAVQRSMLSMGAIRKETEVLAGALGHKRLIAVYGEHPATGADYIAESMRTIYDVKVPVRKGVGQIRRVNVNAAPMSIADYRKIHTAGIGTYQVFQETYHHATYARVHPAGTIKSDYKWRLYALHRAMEAGIDDVAIGALFGLYDWRFEVMGMLAHARDLERVFGIGPHTVSVPRIEPAVNTKFNQDTPYRVSGEDFKRTIAVLRLSIPYAGLIITCREQPDMIRTVIPMCTQRDASSRIGIGAYSQDIERQQEKKQQFILGDTRSLDEVIRELAAMGYITSFCTAGYRCGRTGKKIMTLLRTGQEGCFCKLNAILTFQEWIEDFASAQTRAIGEKIIEQEIAQVKVRQQVFTQAIIDKLLQYHQRIKNGERDLCF